MAEQEAWLQPFVTTSIIENTNGSVVLSSLYSRVLELHRRNRNLCYLCDKCRYLKELFNLYLMGMSFADKTFPSWRQSICLEILGSPAC